jgi:UDP-N-acetylglucosamine--N-acetylmuramyl-(pentapeptide) pyrophosphoryl-undecaprenol N-acetylglucosamine transferase
MSGGGAFIVCGGTGGHLAPGIAIAQRLQASGVAVRLGVSRKEVDARLLHAYPQINYICFAACPFSWRLAGFMRFNWWLFTGLFSALAYLVQHRPRVVLAFGGYVSVHFGLAARLLGIPLVLHEANRVPGRTIRLLAGLAEAVFVPEGIHVGGVAPRRLHHLGMPLREEIQHVRKEAVRRSLDMPFHSKILLVVGGSQGAQVLNEWVDAHWRALAANRISVIVVTGSGKTGKLSDKQIDHADGSSAMLKVLAFSDRMSELLSCADLVVGRAGAGTIAEMIECLTPAILIPYPHAADDHQTANARFLEQRGGCLLLAQGNLSQLYDEVNDLIYNDWMLDRFRMNLKRMARLDAAGVLGAYLQATYFQTPAVGVAEGEQAEVKHVPA